MKNDLTRGSAGYRILRLTFPMIGGMFAMTSFHLTDTYFVSRLGTEPLAAMSFSFPVVMVVGSVAMGLGMGVGAVVSRAIGTRDTREVRGLVTDGLLLGILVVSIVSVCGLIWLDPLFRALGASEAVLPMVRSYMRIWFSCVSFLFIPMIANNAIRATGDTLIPGLMMSLSAILNAILDPIFIFGYFGVPALELEGAAIATVISRAMTVVVSLSVVHYRLRLLDFTTIRLKRLRDSWKRILHTAGPASMTQLLMPLSMAWITRMVAGYGEAAVAGAGAGGRILNFVYLVPMAMGTAMIPFLGQNWGAKRVDRVYEGWTFSCRLGLLYGAVTFAISLFFARWLAGFFSSDPNVTGVIALFLVIALVGSGMQHIAVFTAFSMNAIGWPMHASALNLIRSLALMVPLAYLGARWNGLNGIFIGMTVAQIVSGILAIGWLRRILIPICENSETGGCLK